MYKAYGYNTNIYPQRTKQVKITKRQLRRIIKEEKAKLIKESVEENAQLMDLWNQMLNEFGRQFPETDMSYYGNKILAAMEEERVSSVGSR